MIEIGLVVLEIQKAEFGNFTVPVNNTLVCHLSFFVFLATDTLLYVLIIHHADSCAPGFDVSKRIQQTFGASLLHLDGGCYDDPWCKLWLRYIAVKNCHYELPNGSVERNFVNLLSSEVNLLAQGYTQSVKVLCLYLQCCSMIQWFKRVLIFIAC